MFFIFRERFLLGEAFVAEDEYGLGLCDVERMSDTWRLNFGL